MTTQLQGNTTRKALLRVIITGCCITSISMVCNQTPGQQSCPASHVLVSQLVLVVCFASQYICSCPHCHSKGEGRALHGCMLHTIQVPSRRNGDQSGFVQTTPQTSNTQRVYCIHQHRTLKAAGTACYIYHICIV